jgi:hypothetical protein
MENDKKKPTSVTAVHSLAQRSHTLYHNASKKLANHGTTLTRKVGRNMDIARSKSVTHFEKRPIVESARIATATKRKPDIGPVKHPLANKVENKYSLSKSLPAKPILAKSAQTIKQEAITKALDKPTVKPKNENFIKRHIKFINIFSISIILLVLAGYFTYLNIPNISVHVASAQAGINATYPEYRPDGYSLNGPVSYGDGEVTINFHANTGNTNFTIKQSKSSWDSSALKNQVKEDSEDIIKTTEERGLTIYTYDNNTVWVNGGILYSITGDAPLSSDQIRRIATSL